MLWSHILLFGAAARCHFFSPVGSGLNSVWRRISNLHPPIINNMRNRSLFREAGCSDGANVKVSALINERLSAGWCFIRHQASLWQEEQSKPFNKVNDISSLDWRLFILPFNLAFSCRSYFKYLLLWSEFKNFCVVKNWNKYSFILYESPLLWVFPQCCHRHD